MEVSGLQYADSLGINRSYLQGSDWSMSVAGCPIQFLRKTYQMVRGRILSTTWEIDRSHKEPHHHSESADDNFASKRDVKWLVMDAKTWA